jgi:ATP-dependent RNA helicase RhlE
LSSKRFSDFSLSAPLLRAVREEGYIQPTPIQTEAIPRILSGRDVMAAAQTGTGKTAAFCLPMIERLRARVGPGPRALVLTPTRELALQIHASIVAYGRHAGLTSAVILGGAPIGGQIQALARRPDILVATPGRLLDLIRQKHVRLDRVEMLVLDEADRMLDMGFIHDVRKVVSMTGRQRQTLLFSATLPPGVAELASDMLVDPITVRSDPDALMAARVDHRVLFVDRDKKLELLARVLSTDDVSRALVFTGTKHRADRLVRYLEGRRIAAAAIHSNKSQNQRQRNLAAFHQGRIKVLVATDIVARGIDVDRITHVVNYELPKDPESYVHRTGRTARAAESGIAISFCDADEVPLLESIEKLIRQPLPIDHEHRFHSARIASMRHDRARDTLVPHSRRRRSPRSHSRPRRVAVGEL